MLLQALAITAAVSGVAAQRPSGTSICDYYTTALLKNNTAENQLTLLTLVVNTAVIGNYTTPNHNAVPGILTPGTINGTDVSLAKYFNGSLASSNRGGTSGVSVNYLDDGGAVPLKMNKPANGTSSNQYTLLTHLYEYFGSILGCSMQGMTGYSAYDGDVSQYQVHKFMDLSYPEVSYFIQQVALSAQSFGVASSDLAVAGTALNSLFNVKMAAPVAVIPAQGAQLQSICDDDSCPLAPNSTTVGYQNVTKPVAANSSNSADPSSTTSTGSSSSATSTSSGSGSKTSTTSIPGTATGKSDASTAVGLSMMAVFGGALAFLV